MNQHFAGMTAIVTGGLGGIGFATSMRLAGDGANLVLVDLDKARPEQVDELKSAGAPGVLSLACDVSDEEQVDVVCRAAVQAFGPFHFLVNVAGLATFKPLVELSSADWTRVISVNLLGAVYFTTRALRVIPSGGAIVNVSSIHALQTGANLAPYAASKAGLLSLTRSTAIEGKSRGIRANAVLPGAVDTPLLWNNPNVKSGGERIAPEDVASPAAIASAIALLLSNDAGFVTGATLTVDGGRLAQL